MKTPDTGRPRLAILMALLVLVSGAFLSAFGAKKSVPAGDAVWVQKSDGTLQCDSASGVGLEKMAAELEKAKIQVLSSRKGTDGKVRMQMCGTPTGSQNQYSISRGDLATAQKLGFSEVPASQGVK